MRAAIFILNRPANEPISPIADSHARARAKAEAEAVGLVGANAPLVVQCEGSDTKTPKRDRSHRYDLKPRPRRLGLYKPRPPSTSRALGKALLASDEHKMAMAAMEERERGR